MEVLDLSAGLAAALLPLLVLSVPGIILFFVLPAILLLALAAPLAVIGAVIAAPPYLLARWLRRRRRPSRSADVVSPAVNRYAGLATAGSGMGKSRANR